MNVLVTDGETCDVHDCHVTCQGVTQHAKHASSKLLNLLASAGDKVAVSAHTREATALLLPTALAHLDQMASSAQHAKQAVSKPQHAQHGGAAVTAGVKAEIGNVANIAADNVRSFYEKELMMYLKARVKSPQGEAFNDLIHSCTVLIALFLTVILSTCFAVRLCAELLAKGSRPGNIPHLQIFACLTQVT